jgi:hypothetical protein
MWLENNYVRKVPPEECRIKKAYYLPIFVVVDMERESTKTRVVCDGKVKFNNKSLNDAVMSGPSMIRDPRITLTRFRMRNVAFTADVSQMFLRVYMKEEDRPFHRFLHTETLGGVPEEYEFLVHSFGNPGSPTVAITAARMHAELHQKKFPRAAETIIESTHVDDSLDSFDTFEEAVEVAKACKKIHDEIGMNLRKFASNSACFMKHIAQEDWAKGYSLLNGLDFNLEMPNKKALGLHWDTKNDILTFEDISEVIVEKKSRNTKKLKKYKYNYKKIDITDLLKSVRSFGVYITVYNPGKRVTTRMLENQQRLG